MSDCLRLYIHQSSSDRCLAKGVHRSGSRLRPISFNDVLYGSDNSIPCGVVLTVETEKVDRENWLYRVTYVPMEGTLHPIDSFVVWRQPPMEQQPVIPQPVVQRLQAPPPAPAQQPAIPAPAPNGRRQRHKKQSVNGQQGNGSPASAPLATATV